jgi:hypothetical protein
MNPVSCFLFLELSSSSTDNASLPLSTAERTTGAIDDETLFIPATADEAEVGASTLCNLGNLLQLSWARGGAEVEANLTHDATSEVNDDDVDFNIHEFPQQHYQRVPIGIASTPPNIKLQHDFAKQLAGLRFMRKLRRRNYIRR